MLQYIVYNKVLYKFIANTSYRLCTIVKKRKYHLNMMTVLLHVKNLSQIKSYGHKLTK